ncbi:hypothetical protein [Nocardia sp. CDC160]|uniref:hypothetical protein n=1 Tax=Nocardia sp. CDC160 TaxID=3112166 RepID=UPI002DBD2E3B|nr:hypothetical protein [Nocardia sp. CDC160]MEC3913672.1 hypothetical protein [Nocardia sp. CDC160]
MSTPAAEPGRLEFPCADGTFTPCVARAVRSLLSTADSSPGRRASDSNTIYDRGAKA